MALNDPFAAYNAGSNLEAHLVGGLLNDAGIASQVIEDVSQVGIGWVGPLSEIHKPQVWPGTLGHRACRADPGRV